MIYKNYIVVGIHTRIIRNKPRRFITLRHSTGKYKQIPYAKYLMEQHLGYELPKGQEVDHKDENCMNDVLSNLQVLTKPVHTAKTNRNRIRKKKCL